MPTYDWLLSVNLIVNNVLAKPKTVVFARTLYKMKAPGLNELRVEMKLLILLNKLHAINKCTQIMNSCMSVVWHSCCSSCCELFYYLV